MATSLLGWSRISLQIELQPVEIQVDLDMEKFYKTFVDLLLAPTPKKN